MTTLRRGDSDLHNEDGTHRSTPTSADGRVVELYDRRLARHLEAHQDIIREKNMSEQSGSIQSNPIKVQTGPDPLVTVVAGYIIGSVLHGGLDLSLISVDASTNDNRATFTIEGKHNRKRLQISVRELHDTP